MDKYQKNLEDSVLSAGVGAQSIQWRTYAGWFIYSSPAIGEDIKIYICSANFNLYALDSSAGTINWGISLSGSVCSSPVITLDRIFYIGSSNFYFYAYPHLRPTRRYCLSMVHYNSIRTGSPGYDQWLADLETTYPDFQNTCPDECGGKFCSYNQEASNEDNIRNTCYQSIELSNEQIVNSFVDNDGQTVEIIEYEFTITNNEILVEGAEIFLEVEVV